MMEYKGFAAAVELGRGQWRAAARCGWRETSARLEREMAGCSR